MKIVLARQQLFLEFVSDSNQIVRAELEQNKKYVLSDGVTLRIIQLYGNASIVVESDLQDSPNRYKNQDLTDKKLISIREGGAGDLLFKTPVFKYLKEKYPSCKISLACSPMYHSLFNHHPHIDTIYAHLLPYEEFIKHDYFATFEGVIETNKEAEHINAYDLYIQKYGIPLEDIRDKTPVINVNGLTKDFWRFTLGDALTSEKKKIGYQWRASSPVRTLPAEKNAEIIKGLSALGYTVYLIDSVSRKNDVAKFIQMFKLQVVDTSKYSDNFERMAGIISLMDLYVGPDSSGTHIAASVGIPVLGMYGPFRSSLRLKYYKNAVGIDVIAKRCGNGCYIHSYELCDFAAELGDTFAPCWKLLPTELVVDQVDKLYKRVYNE